MRDLFLLSIGAAIGASLATWLIRRDVRRAIRSLRASEAPLRAAIDANQPDTSTRQTAAERKETPE